MSRKYEEAVLAIVVATPLVVAFMAALAVYYGWALSVIWSMTAVPIFGASQLTIAQCIGLSVLVSTVKPAPNLQYKDHDRDSIKEMGATLLAPLVGILFAWCAMQYYPMVP